MLKSIKSTVKYLCLFGCFLTDHPIVCLLTTQFCSTCTLVLLNLHIGKSATNQGSSTWHRQFWIDIELDLSHPPPTMTLPLTLRAPQEH
jgi:hypothetical protein